VSFVEDLEQIGKRLDQAQSSYHGAFNKLISGKGNLIKAAERVKELGVKPSKIISKYLSDLDND
jgi:DNA recombination protein RmuC